MKENWTLVYWASNDRKQQVEAWLDFLNKEQLKTVSKELLLLERCGSQLRLPHSKALGKGLFELRERTFGYRIYYSFLPNQTIVLLHAGKKSDQQKDIEIARLRLDKLNESERYETKEF